MPFHPTDLLLVLLLICMIGEVVLAASYLHTRSLTLSQTIGWGALVVFIPLLGPFLAIASRPGKALPNAPRQPVSAPRRPNWRSKI